VRSGSCQPKQRQRAENLQRIAAKDHVAPIEAVGHVPRRQQKQQPRQKQRQARIAKVERSMGNGIDLPPHRDGLRLGT
jgi:hypothetical protein